MDNDKLIKYRTYSDDIEVLSCRNSFSFAPHIHDRYVLWLSGGSSEKYRVRGNSGLLGKGSFSILEPFVVHENTTTEHRFRDLRSFYISSGFLDSLCRQISDNENSGFRLTKEFFKDKDLYRKLKHLHCKMLNNEESIEDCYLILSEIIKNHCENIDEKDFGYDDLRIRKIKEYMNDNYHGKITLEDLSQITGITPFHLIKLFRKSTGMTPHKYLIQIRLEKVREKLIKGVNITEASFSSGFSDQSHLTRAFTKRYGITPGKFTV